MMTSFFTVCSFRPSSPAECGVHKIQSTLGGGPRPLVQVRAAAHTKVAFRTMVWLDSGVIFRRSIRPPYDPSDITPNSNPPGSVPPSTVGPDQLVHPGDPHGVTVTGPADAGTGPPPRIIPSAWSGWPAGWWPPMWG